MSDQDSHITPITVDQYHPKAMVRLKSGRKSLWAGLALSLQLAATGASAQVGKWEQTASMATARDAFAALATKGKVYAFGGRLNPDGFTARMAEIYTPGGDGAVAAFALSGDMTTDRSFFPLVTLTDGISILAPGGFRRGAAYYTTTRTAEVFNTNTGKWTATGSMQAARELFTGTRLPDGSVLVAGGFSNGAILSTSEVYTPATGTFAFTRGGMTNSRHGHAAVLIPGVAGYALAGKVLVIGGRTVQDASLFSSEVFDPARGCWEAGPASNEDRFRHTATALNDGRVLLAGGYSSKQGKTLATAEIYDPAANAFTLLDASNCDSPTMSDTRMDHTATLLTGGKVLLVGGWSSVKASTVGSADIFDPTVNPETHRIRGFVQAAPLPGAGRHEHIATLLPDGKRVLVAGGLRVEGNLKQTLTDACIFTP